VCLVAVKQTTAAAVEWSIERREMIYLLTFFFFLFRGFKSEM
jgi:hypothetical protein